MTYILVLFILDPMVYISNFYLFIYFCCTGLPFCLRAFSSCRGGYSLVVVHRLLPAVAFLAAEHGLWACGFQWMRAVDSVLAALRLEGLSSAVVGHRLSCPTACGIFPDQGSNLCPLPWQPDAYSLHHQGSPILFLKMKEGLFREIYTP